ncbi:hypothetical protein RA27_02165 [Ruegeria sp. ANG-R]|uniref:helix-turn-helix transcriptional regulator n=1 Tax=Ruegeria sp. ANG-R TaxID=1577903 RepID=UPI00057D1721|nr:LuxR family transcriptional regulator [Ruegeria sp. ANG-R]KIC42218.1 hypothetical protein RA27_02165 [Ruegeria sp. ANG-R]
MNIVQPISTLTDSFAFNAGTNPYQPQTVHSTYRPDWLEKYIDNQWYKSDPVAKKAHASLVSRTPLALTPEDTSCDMYEEARAYGADANIVFATQYGGNILIIGAQVDNPTSVATQRALADATQLSHRLTTISKLSALSDRQFEVLELADSGLQVSQIAAEMDITEAAVARLKQRICERLDVRQWNIAVNSYSLEKWGSLIAR